MTDIAASTARTDLEEENRRRGLLGLDFRPPEAAENTQKNAADTQKKAAKGRPRGKSFAPGNAEEITRVIVKDAVRGRPTALKQCLGHFVPRARERTLALDLPAVTTVEEAARAAGQLTALIGAGTLTPGEGKAIASVIEAQRCTLDLRDHSRRLTEVEHALEALRSLVSELLRSEIVVPAGAAADAAAQRFAQ
jgi:hypothetical protein